MSLYSRSENVSVFYIIQIKHTFWIYAIGAVGLLCTTLPSASLVQHTRKPTEVHLRARTFWCRTECRYTSSSAVQCVCVSSRAQNTRDQRTERLSCPFTHTHIHLNVHHAVTLHMRRDEYVRIHAAGPEQPQHALHWFSIHTHTINVRWSEGLGSLTSALSPVLLFGDLQACHLLSCTESNPSSSSSPSSVHHLDYNTGVNG